MSRQLKSQFARRLASDKTSNSSSFLIVQTLKQAANDEIEAVERSEQLSRDDYAVYINARTDNSLPGSD
jgi:DNA-binding transcriptional regulator YiaG